MNYFSPCGYVAPAYYDNVGANWLSSFTAGYLTTCGLQAVGSPCEDEGETLPLHGSIANTPSEHTWWVQEGDELVICGVTKDETIFGRKLRLSRQIRVSLAENSFRIVDRIENTGDRTEPGTTVTLHLNEDSLEFANEYRVREILEKYCSFMPTEIYLSKEDTKETQTIKELCRR